jgi:F420-non-reducing hydrogenase iron-sulfur subunit
MVERLAINQVEELKPSQGFAPEITIFTCAYCGYMAADTAGALRQSYPANVKIVRLPCTGKTDIQYLLDAFDGGADGVYVVACSLGNCHHERGNERARARVARARLLLETIGLEPERLDIFYLSGSMGATFAQIARQMTDRIRALGPSPLKPARAFAAPAPNAGPPTTRGP